MMEHVATLTRTHANTSYLLIFRTVLIKYFLSLDEKYIYRPQTKFAKVMFSQVSVCPQRGGGVSASGPKGCGRRPPDQCMLGYTSPSPVDTTGYGQQAGGTHLTGMHSCFIRCLRCVGY